MPALRRSFLGRRVAQHRFKDGKIVETWLVSDNLDMMQQLGVIPATQPA